MDTAREIAKSAKGEYPLSLDMLEDEIKHYAKQKCKEQRSLCLKNWSKPSEGEFEDAQRIQYAPEPDME